MSDEAPAVGGVVELASLSASGGAATPAASPAEAAERTGSEPEVAAPAHETLSTYERAPTLSVIRSSPYLLYEFATKGAELYWNKPALLGKELLAGVIVAIMQLPESVAFSYVAGVPPAVGLQSTVILGFITGLLGGKAAMISGCAGAMAVIAKEMTSDTGPLGHLDLDSRILHLFTAMTVCGFIQILAGVLRLGNLARLIPATAMIGFMNGLAIVIFIAQLTAFQTCDGHTRFYDCDASERKWLQPDEGRTWATVGIALVSTAIMFSWPLLPRVGPVVPAPLVAIIVGSLFEHFINRPFIGAPTRTIDETAPISGGLAAFQVPWANLGTVELGEVFRFGAVFAAVGLIESVMTLQAVNELTGTVPTMFAVSQECVAQGLGNLVSSFFGAMGGDTMIGQSTININSGARGRISGMTAAIVLLIIVVVASSVVNLVPVAALTGVLFAIVIKTFNWNTFRVLFRIPRIEALTIILVTVLAVLMDLAIAVFAGVALTAIASSWNTARLVEVESRDVAAAASHDGKPSKVYTVKGALFFASTRALVEEFDVEGDPDHVYLDLRASIISDFSAIEAVHAVARKYKEAKKHLHVTRLCPRSMRRLERLLGADSEVATLYADGTTSAAGGPPSPDLATSARRLSQLHMFDVPDVVTQADAEAALEDDEDIDIVDRVAASSPQVETTAAAAV